MDLIAAHPPLEALVFRMDAGPPDDFPHGPPWMKMTIVGWCVRDYFDDRYPRADPVFSSPGGALRSSLIFVKLPDGNWGFLTNLDKRDGMSFEEAVEYVKREWMQRWG